MGMHSDGNVQEIASILGSERMINDLVTAFLVAFAAVIASELLSRIWEYF
jgi:hypothetical protein